MEESIVGIIVGIRQGLKSTTDGNPSTSSFLSHATEDVVTTISAAEVT